MPRQQMGVIWSSIWSRSWCCRRFVSQRSNPHLLVAQKCVSFDMGLFVNGDFVFSFPPVNDTVSQMALTWFSGWPFNSSLWCCCVNVTAHCSCSTLTDWQGLDLWDWIKKFDSLLLLLLLFVCWGVTPLKLSQFDDLVGEISCRCSINRAFLLKSYAWRLTAEREAFGVYSSRRFTQSKCTRASPSRRRTHYCSVI